MTGRSKTGVRYEEQRGGETQTRHGKHALMQTDPDRFRSSRGGTVRVSARVMDLIDLDPDLQAVPDEDLRWGPDGRLGSLG